MTIEVPRAALLPSLRALWREAFGDSDAFLDLFFDVAYAPSRARCIVEDGEALAALYWFDVSLDGKNLAYLYAIATRADRRGEGLCRRLMEDVHARLARQGYAGALLVPSEPSLFDFYANFGYEPCAPMQTILCRAEGEPIVLRRVDADEYGRLRARLLPLGGVVQEGDSLRLLARQESLFAGDGFVLAAHSANDRLVATELLGDTSLAPQILATLQLPEGRFRIAGNDRPFAMLRKLSAKKDFPPPSYFALAFD